MHRWKLELEYKHKHTSKSTSQSTPHERAHTKPESAELYILLSKSGSLSPPNQTFPSISLNELSKITKEITGLVLNVYYTPGVSGKHGKWLYVFMRRESRKVGRKYNNSAGMEKAGTRYGSQASILLSCSDTILSDPCSILGWNCLLPLIRTDNATTNRKEERRSVLYRREKHLNTRENSFSLN